MALPELLSFVDGRTVTAQNWSERRMEIVSLFANQVFGLLPPAPEKVTVKAEPCPRPIASGHASHEKLLISFDTPKGTFAFPAGLVMPKNGKKNPVFIFISFDSTLTVNVPIEEIVDYGFGVAYFGYEDVSSDDGNFADGLAACFPRTGKGNEWGKIGMWAYAASRMADYLLTRDDVDPEALAVIGHSRLGKTALWCGINDERIQYVISNDSGCSGAALCRDWNENAESVEAIYDRFPFWFCPNYAAYTENTEVMPFDQHFLLGAIAPRHLLVGSGSLDAWANPAAEKHSVIEASKAWELLGLKGYIDNGCDEAGKEDLSGHAAYHLRDGVHFLGRADWLSYMNYIESRL